MSIILEGALYSALGFVGGSALACQIGINIQLGLALSDGVRATMVCCAVNFLGLLPFALLIKPRAVVPQYAPPSGESNEKEVLPPSPPKPKWWMYTAGFLTSFIVMSTIFLGPILGVAMYFLVSFVGNITSSILVDHFGFLVAKNPIKPQLLMGVALAFVAIFFVSFMSPEWKVGIQMEGNLGLTIGAMIIAFVIGILVTFQAIVHKNLNACINQPFRTLLVTAAVSTLFLLIITAALTPWFPWTYQAAAPKWCWVGGLLGDLFLFSNVLAPPKIGFASYFVLMLVGQLATALVVDHFGAFGVQPRAASAPRVLGVLCSLMAALMMRLDVAQLVRCLRGQRGAKGAEWRWSLSHRGAAGGYESFQSLGRC